MCNNPAHSFVRLFVDFGVSNDDDDDESLSLSSDDESIDDEIAENYESIQGDGDTEPSTEPSNDSVTERTAGSATFDYNDQDDSEQEADDVSVIFIHDVPALNHQRKEKCRKMNKSAGSSGGIKIDSKYKQMAKRYKTRVAMLESQRKQQGEERQKLLLKLKQHGDHLRRATHKLKTNRKECEDHERILEDRNLQLVRLQRELAEKSTMLISAQQAASKAQQQLSEEMELYQRKLSRVSAASMNEVQQMIDERPKLVNQIRTLKEEVQRLQRGLSIATGGRSVGDPHPRYGKRKGDESHTAVKKILRAMDDGRESESQSARDIGEDENGERIKKWSARSERMRALARPGQIDCRKSSALAALDAVDNIVQLEPILPSFLFQKPDPRRRPSTSLSTSSSQMNNRVRFTSASEQKKLAFGGKTSLK